MNEHLFFQRSVALFSLPNIFP